MAIKSWRFWAHIGLIAFLVLGTLQLVNGVNMLNVKSWMLFVPLLAIADIIAERVFSYRE